MYVTHHRVVVVVLGVELHLGHLAIVNFDLIVIPRIASEVIAHDDHEIDVWSRYLIETAFITEVYVTTDAMSCGQHPLVGDHTTSTPATRLVLTRPSWLQLVLPQFYSIPRHWETDETALHSLLVQ